MEISNDLSGFDINKIYKVNSDFEKEIFDGIPADFSKLEQAIYIYYNLCKKLDYSLDYYINEHSNMSRFTTADYIENVNGKDNKEVVCYTFDRILLRMLFDKGLISLKDFWDNASYIVPKGVIPPLHNRIMATIDGMTYTIDGTMGIFKDCDLTLSKFADFEMRGWNIANEGGCSEPAKVLKSAQKKVVDFVDGKFNYALKQYKIEKQKEDDWTHYSIDIRAEMFLSLVDKNVDKSETNSLAYIYKIKHQLFDFEETSNMSISQRKVMVNFMFNKQTQGATCIFAFSNSNKIKAYQIDLHTPKSPDNAIIRRSSFEQIMDEYHDEKLIDISTSETLERQVTLMRQNAQYYDMKNDYNLRWTWKKNRL